MEKQKPDKKKKPRLVWLVILLICLLIVAAALFIYIRFYLGSANGHGAYDPHLETLQPSQSTEAESQQATTEIPTTETPTTVELVENPVDFTELWQQNEDIIGWIYIPNTDISLPIVCPPQGVDDNYYIHKDINKEYDFKGMIFTQKVNATDFTDPVTLVYGHNMLDGTMFSNLHMFRDSAFFDENDTFYIYLPGHILTYEIVSAYQYDTRHIINCFDFSKKEVLQEYIDSMLHPKAMISDVREGVKVTTEDRIVTLSTCIERGKARYLVQGVLIKDEPTY